MEGAAIFRMAWGLRRNQAVVAGAKNCILPQWQLPPQCVQALQYARSDPGPGSLAASATIPWSRVLCSHTQQGSQSTGPRGRTSRATKRQMQRHAGEGAGHEVELEVLVLATSAVSPPYA